ncbi:HS6-type ribosomal protein [Tubulinosema ratisbonensis]|uniref:HS6-type ribosomal protein n=1 Tax=Tubulinosema ratisbonensis TaxID=291195 RepID=A0A437AJ77_9MICR|nr:HS6-type ribosomal protein [Tubulinosema ratisbonensis]
MIPIAHPLINDQSLKLIQKYIESNIDNIKRGIKHCTKKVNSSDKGLLVLSADTTPMDLITHLPILCEKRGLEYCFVKNMSDLKSAAPESEYVSCVFIEEENVKELFKLN